MQCLLPALNMSVHKAILNLLAVQVAFLLQDTMTKATYKRRHFFGAHSFRGLEFMTIMIETMSAGRQAGMHGHKTIAKSSHIKTQP